MMKNFDAARGDGAPLYCYCCEREIPGGNWFARFPAEGRLIAFCRPRCLEVFLERREQCAGDSVQSSLGGVADPAPSAGNVMQPEMQIHLAPAV